MKKPIFQSVLIRSKFLFLLFKKIALFFLKSQLDYCKDNCVLKADLLLISIIFLVNSLIVTVTSSSGFMLKKDKL